MGNVVYDLEVYDDVPEPPKRSYVAREGGGPPSQLEINLATIKEWDTDAPGYGKFVRIGLYKNGSAASAAKNVLGQRHGKKVEVEGWEFLTRRLTEGSAENAEPYTGLFARYTPDAIVEGEAEKWAFEEKLRLAKLEAKRAAREAAKAEDDEGEELEDEDEELDDDEYEEDEEGYATPVAGVKA